MNIQSNTPATALEVADIFRDHGPAWRLANAGHVSVTFRVKDYRIDGPGRYKTIVSADVKLTRVADVKLTHL